MEAVEFFMMKYYHNYDKIYSIALTEGICCGEKRLSVSAGL